ncbi:MAG: hypothetical protein HY847_08250 [Betaproteobacteria bacterium]|nr:hypothetical protein [Betaproteobacteria bacterium]
MDKAECPPASKHGRSAVGRALRSAASLVGVAVGCVLGTGAVPVWAQGRSFLPPLQLKSAKEIAPFRLTAIEGDVTVKVLSDSHTNIEKPEAIAGNPAAATAEKASRNRQSNVVYEVNLKTQSYIYHPSLVTLDVSGGPLIDKGKYDTDGVVTNSRRQMYNFNGRATILRDKPYTGLLFLERQNENQSVGPAQEMLTENTRYGLTFKLLNPVTPIPLQVDLSRTENQGRGAEQVIDNRIDQFHLKMDAHLGRLGWSSFQGIPVNGTSTLMYDGARLSSASGSVSLPIHASRSSDDRINLDTQLKLGAGNEYDLTNVVILHNNSYAAGPGQRMSLSDFSFSLDLIGRHSEELQTNGRYTLNTSQHGDQDATQNSASAGINYRFSPDLSGSLGVRGDIGKSTQIDSTAYGFDGAAQYLQDLPVGKATARYGFSYSQRDQTASAQQARVIGERVTLTGIAQATLEREQIVDASVTVVNLTHTQTFVEGMDYTLSRLGSRLRIRRLTGGSILDGQEVLIDYAYDTGGSYGLNQLENSVALGWAYKSYLNVFLNHAVSSPKITSGFMTTPLNPARTTFYGARSELPVSLLEQELVLGGSAEFEDRRETLAPFKRKNFEAYTQIDLPWVRSGSLRLGARRLQVDYDYSPENGVNQQSRDLRVGARLGYGFDLSAEAIRVRDTGTPLYREYSTTSIKAKWQRRKIKATFDLSRVREIQGKAENNRIRGQFMLRRDF